MNNRNKVLFAVALALVALPGHGDSQRHQYIVMTKYLFVQPNASAPPPLATVVPKLGGHVDHSWNDRLVITLPDRAIDEVRQHAGVKYVQRVVTGPFTGHAQALSTSATSLRPSPTTTPPTWASGTYTYDNAGNITGIGNDTFIYDSLSRLKTANIKNKREDYEYDAYGNLTYKLTHDPDLPVGNQDRTVDLTARTDLATNRIGQEPYDPAGNDQGPNGTYLYDSFNMLRQKAPLGVPSYYVYTPDDQRIGSITCPSGPGDCWDQFWLISIRDVNGNVIRQYESPYYMPGTPSWPAAWKEDYVYRDGVLIGAERPAEEGGRRYFHVDHLGTPRLVTGAGAQRIAEHDYYPFGVEITPLAQETANGFDREDPLKFTGHERDLNSGTSPPNNVSYDDYLHARYRVPDWGRFLSVDPVIDTRAALHYPQIWNRYAYVRNNPINLNDPRGLLPAEVIYSPDAFDETWFSFTSDPEDGGGFGSGKPSSIAAPTLPNGELAPPPVPPPPGESGQPNEWVYRPNNDPKPGQRPGRWGPRDRVPSPTGAQPNASWDDKHGHWDIYTPSPGGRGKPSKDRYLPDGTRLGPDHKPQPNQSISVVRLPSFSTWPVQVPFTVMGWYMKQIASFWYGGYDCGCSP